MITWDGVRSQPSRIGRAQAWFRWATRRLADAPAWPATLLLVTVLAAATAIVALGIIAVATSPSLGFAPGAGFVLALVVSPAAYLAAWQVMSFGSLTRALLGAATALLLCGIAFISTVVAGFATLGVAVPVAALASVSVIADRLARLDDADRAPDGGAGRFAHTAGLVVVLIGLVPAAMRVETPDGRAFAVALLVAATLPHALLTSVLRGSALPTASRLLRGSALVAIGLLLPVPFLGWAWMIAR